MLEEVPKQSVPGNNIEFQVADAQALPFAGNSFDVVVCQFGFMFVPDKPKAFGEAYRVLRPGGMLLFNTWDAIENNPLSANVSEVVAAYFPAPGLLIFIRYHFPRTTGEALM